VLSPAIVIRPLEEEQLARRHRFAALPGPRQPQITGRNQHRLFVYRRHLNILNKGRNVALESENIAIEAKRGVEDLGARGERNIAEQSSRHRAGTEVLRSRS
jgi:hypothetical protein